MRVLVIDVIKSKQGRAVNYSSVRLFWVPIQSVVKGCALHFFAVKLFLQLKAYTDNPLCSASRYCFPVKLAADGPILGLCWDSPVFTTKLNKRNKLILTFWSSSFFFRQSAYGQSIYLKINISIYTSSSEKTSGRCESFW